MMLKHHNKETKMFVTRRPKLSNTTNDETFEVHETIQV